MSEKLYDIISKVSGTKVKLFGKELTLKKFSLGTLFLLKEKYGLTADNFMQKVQESPIEYSPALVWELLVEKEEFETYEKFLDCMDLQNVMALTTALQSAFTDGQPVIKNEEGSKE